MRFFHTKIRQYLLICSIFLLFFIPRIISLGTDMNNLDSQYWYPRIENFTKNLLEGNLRGTYQKYHPGTTLLWLSGTSKFAFEKAFEYKYNFSPSKYPHQFPKLDFFARLPLVAVISLLGAICYWYIKRLIDKRFAIIFSAFLSLEPFFLGISRYLHLTALSTMFGFTCFVALVYARRNNSKKHFIISGILLGLAIATKISLLILLPTLGIILLPTIYEISKKYFISQFAKSTLALLALITIASITFVAISPYMWVNPVSGLTRIYREGIIGEGFGGGMPVALINNQYTFYLETALLRTSSFVFIFFLIGIVLFIKNTYKSIQDKSNKTNEQTNHNIKINSLIIYSVILFVTYYLALSIPAKLKDRYYVELMPPLLIIATYGIHQILNSISKVKSYILLAIYVVLQISYTMAYFPSSSFYYSELVGGPAGYDKLGMRPTNRGEWYGEAALYLNKYDPRPENQNVILGNESLVNTFGRYFYGTTYAELGAIPDRKGYKVKYIVTRKDNQRFVPLEVCDINKAFGSRFPYKFEDVFIYECPNMLKDDLTKLIPTFPDY